jgi:phage repressor protein C with HTH and peptisase S24 domain
MMPEMVRDAGRIDEDGLPVTSSLDQQTASLPAHDANEEENQSSTAENPPNEKEQELAKLAEQIEALAVPGYAVTTEGVFTTVTRTRKLAQRDSYLTQIARYAFSRTFSQYIH